MPPAIAWSPSGDFILAGSNLINVHVRTICSILAGNGQGFVSADRIIVHSLPKTGPQRLEFFDTQCKSMGHWTVGYPEWALADVSPDRGLIALLRKNVVGPAPFDELLVVDSRTHAIVQHWPTSQTGYYARFATRGNVICTGNSDDDATKNRNAPPRCMDVNSGNQIVEGHGIDGGDPFSTAEDGNIAIASDYRHTFNIFYREYDTTLRKRVVWNFDKNTIIASWRPQTQFYGAPGFKPFKDPFVFAISPDGHYVAKGGNGILTLYKIEP